MVNIWVSSDYHLNHANIIKYCNRGFSSVDEMNECIIENHNSMIKENDIFIFLGDFCFPRGEKDAEYWANRLNGYKYLIQGNHDTINGPMKNSFINIYDIFEYKHLNHLIVCSHYSIRNWNKSHAGSLHCYGHSHGRLNSYGRSMDVGVDTNNFYPYNLDEIVARLSAIPIISDNDKFEGIDY